MGKWDRRNYARPRRRYYQDYQWSPPRDEPCPDPETEVWQDNVPMWEKKFCYLVGRMPWKKVLSTKNFMNCHSNSNVLSWDDSAGEEAFNIAKTRFWEETNGLSCETQLPNPDMYIDEINWNPYIDPDIAKELDKAYFNPDDKYHLPYTNRSKGGNCERAADVDDHREHGYVQKNKASGWGQWDSSDNGASKSNKDDDPWDCHHIHNDGAVKDKATGWNQLDNSVNHTSKLKSDKEDPWENHCSRGNEVVKDNTCGGEWGIPPDLRPNKYTEMSSNLHADGNAWRKESSGWQDCGASSRSWKQETEEVHSTSYWSNSNRNRPQEYRGSRMPNGRSSQWGQKPRDKYNWGPKDSINIHRGQGHVTSGCRKREGPDHYVANHKGPRLQRDDQPSVYWNEGNNRRFNFQGQ
ncbi:hypothetical protein SOVF_151180 isoform A [Spinacia oleracea]|uniref:Uncharacterized protein isoform X1 n=1 Tax=Spinacia oleracea TaxID=3562 RepID=A0A9R0K0C8_SPIOL|nr:uncharacterized protein LOC110793234 isoform X1 [Spinacia oleracea]KNA09700.1 hypothetical protein SOVF_151180 isoform A [Spinacia oleracea]